MYNNIGAFLLIIMILALSACNITTDAEINIPPIEASSDITPTENFLNQTPSTSHEPTPIQTNNNGKEATHDVITLLVNEDFNILYSDILISADKPFTEIAEDLGIILDPTHLQAIPSVHTYEQTECEYWFSYPYPNIDECVLNIDFYLNSVTKESWLISIYFCNETIETNRGIKIGSGETDLINMYGKAEFTYYSPLFDSTHDTRTYYYSMFPDAFFIQYDYDIFFHVDIDTLKVRDIYITYLRSDTLATFGREDDFNERLLLIEFYEW